MAAPIMMKSGMVSSVKLFNSEKMVSAMIDSCATGMKKYMKIRATEPTAKAIGIPEKRKIKVAAA